MDILLLFFFFLSIVKGEKSNNFLCQSNPSNTCGLYSSRHHLKASFHYSKELCSNNFIHFNHLLNANLFYAFIHLSEPPGNAYHSPNITLLRQTIPGMKATNHCPRGDTGTNTHTGTKRRRCCSWRSPDATRVLVKFLFL